MEPPCETKPIPRFRIADSEGPRACRLGPARAGCTNKPNLPAAPGGRRNSLFVVGDGVFARKTQNTVLGMCGILVFWYSGILGWRPEKRGSGAPARCAFGTWHVAVVKCQVLSGASRAAGPRSPPTSNFTLHTSSSAAGRSCDNASLPGVVPATKPIARSRAPRRCPGIEPKRWMWHPPPYAGHTRGTLQAGFCD